MKTTLAICDLVEDLSLYPRHAVDEANVAALVRALEAGATLPPVVVDKASNRIVDGWHRVRAHKRVLGPTGAIDVELRSYKNEASLVIDAVALNATHGRQFDAIDRARAVLMLEKHGVTIDRIAVALQMPTNSVQKLTLKVAKATHVSQYTVPGTRKIVLKRPVAHLAGKTLNDKQVETHAMLPGTSFLLIAKQLLEALRAEMVNLEDQRLIELLRELRAELATTLP